MTGVAPRPHRPVLSACTRGGPTSIAGSIVGRIPPARPPAARGLPAAAGVAPRTVGVAILGAGMAGLSAAWAFERAGFRDFVVLELEDAPGGTARSGAGPVTPYPWGAHYVPVPRAGNRPARRAARRGGRGRGPRRGGHAGLRRGGPLPRARRSALFFRGAVVRGALPARRRERRRRSRQLRRLRGRTCGAGRAGATPRAGARFAIPRAIGSDAAEVRALDRLSMADYMAGTGWDSPRLRWFVEYGCRDDFGDDASRGTSAWAGDPLLRGAPRGRGRKLRRVPHLAGGERPPGGAPRAGSWGSALRTSALVTDVVPGRDRVEVDLVRRGAAPGARRFARAAASSSRCRASSRRVLIGALARRRRPSFLARDVVRLVDGRQPHPARSARPPRGFPLAWDNVLYDSASLGYVTATHQAGRDHGPTVLTYYLPILDEDPRQGRERLLATTWEQWVETILADLGPRPSGPARSRGARRRLPLGPRDGAAPSRLRVERCAGRLVRAPSGASTSRTPTCPAWRSSRKRSTGGSAPRRPSCASGAPRSGRGSSSRA